MARKGGRRRVALNGVDGREACLLRDGGPALPALALAVQKGAAANKGLAPIVISATWAPLPVAPSRIAAVVVADVGATEVTIRKTRLAPPLDLRCV